MHLRNNNESCCEAVVLRRLRPAQVMYLFFMCACLSHSLIEQIAIQADSEENSGRDSDCACDRYR